MRTILIAAALFKKPHFPDLLNRWAELVRETKKALEEIETVTKSMPYIASDFDLRISEREVKYTVLTAAVWADCPDYIKMVIEMFQNKDEDLPLSGIESLDQHDRTPLMMAAERDHAACVSTLLQCKAQINIKNSHGNTALHIAAQNRCYESVGCLLAFEADVNAQNARGETPLHALILAIPSDNPQREQISELEWLPIVKLLLRETAKLDLRDNNHHTVLMHAVKRGFIKIAELLLQAGADPIAKTGYHRDIYNSEVYYRNQSAFDFAENNPAMLKALYSAKLFFGLSDFKIFEEVISNHKDQCDIHFPCKGKTVYAEAKILKDNGQPQYWELLTSHGLVITDEKPTALKEYLDVSLKKGRSHTVRDLLKKSTATKPDDLVLNTDMKLNDIVFGVTQFCDLATVWPVDKQPRMPRLIKDDKADAIIRPVPIAAADVKSVAPPIKGNLIFSLFTTENNGTVLEVAARYGRFHNAHQLLEQRIDVNHQSKNGNIALHWVAYHCDVAMLKLFCEHSSFNKKTLSLKMEPSLLEVFIAKSKDEAAVLEVLQILQGYGYVLQESDVQRTIHRDYYKVLQKMLELFSNQHKMITNTKQWDNWTPIYMVIAYIAEENRKGNRVNEIYTNLFLKLIELGHRSEALLTIPDNNTKRLLARAIEGRLDGEQMRKLKNMGAIIDDDVLKSVPSYESEPNSINYLVYLFWDNPIHHCVAEQTSWNDALFKFFEYPFDNKAYVDQMIDIVLPKLLPLVDINAIRNDGSTYLHVICRNSKSLWVNRFIEAVGQTHKFNNDTLYKKIPAPVDHKIPKIGKTWNALCFSIYTFPNKNNDEDSVRIVQVFTDIGMDHDFEDAFAIAQHFKLEKTVAALKAAIGEQKLKTAAKSDTKNAAIPVAGTAVASKGDVKTNGDVKTDTANPLVSSNPVVAHDVVDINLKTSANNEIVLTRYFINAIFYGTDEQVLQFIKKIKDANAYGVFLMPHNGKIALWHLLNTGNSKLREKVKLINAVLDVMPYQQLRAEGVKDSLSRACPNILGLREVFEARKEEADLFDCWSAIRKFPMMNGYVIEFINIINNKDNLIGRIKGMIGKAEKTIGTNPLMRFDSDCVNRLAILRGIMKKITSSIMVGKKTANPATELKELINIFRNYHLKYFPDSPIAEAVKDVPQQVSAVPECRLDEKVVLQEDYCTTMSHPTAEMKSAAPSCIGSAPMNVPARSAVVSSRAGSAFAHSLTSAFYVLPPPTVRYALRVELEEAAASAVPVAMANPPKPS